TRQTSDPRQVSCGVKFGLASLLEPHLVAIGPQIAKGDGVRWVLGASTVDAGLEKQTIVRMNSCNKGGRSEDFMLIMAQNSRRVIAARSNAGVDLPIERSHSTGF